MNTAPKDFLRAGYTQQDWEQMGSRERFECYWQVLQEPDPVVAARELDRREKLLPTCLQTPPPEWFRAGHSRWDWFSMPEEERQEAAIEAMVAERPKSIPLEVIERDAARHDRRCERERAHRVGGRRHAGVPRFRLPSRCGPHGDEHGGL